MYTREEVVQMVEEQDVRFVRLVFFDVYGRQKNISILPDQLLRAFDHGIAVDAFEIEGFDNPVHGDLYLHPDPASFSLLPWRSTDGDVVCMVCDVTYPDGTPFEKDSRQILRKAVRHARELGYAVLVSTEFEFYLLDENGPIDQGGYMDVAPLDGGENIRREICFSLQAMEMQPQASYHQCGPGQNEIDFHASPALRAADEASLFKWVVRVIAAANGLKADFSPKPLEQEAGNGMHINLQLECADIFGEVSQEEFDAFLAGILTHIREITLFANPEPASYHRLGRHKAPGEISWSATMRNGLVRIPSDHKMRMEVRSPDCQCNPYLVVALLIEAGLDGIQRELDLEKVPKGQLPVSLPEAAMAASDSDFVHAVVPDAVTGWYIR